MRHNCLKKLLSILLGPYILINTNSVPEIEMRKPKMFSSRSRASARTEKVRDFLIRMPTPLLLLEELQYST